MQQRLLSEFAEFERDDSSIVVSGSLARGEFTAGSDIDWTLLIDGAADPWHAGLARRIAQKVKLIAAKDTGAEGTFGVMVFSHDLVHQIGGQDDTNQNTTRRLLLLLESRPAGRDDAYARVIRSILSRYLLEDRGFLRGSPFRVPRFLQNDFARYWRTIAVDFAYKLRDRSGKGWAIRSAKLRMSRKMIYVSSLLACYRCHLDHDAQTWKKLVDSDDGKSRIVEYFENIFRQTPLEITAGVLLQFPHLAGSAHKILGAYDEFLGLLADGRTREHLETLPEDDADRDPTYQKARQLSHRFRDGLLEFFFDKESGLDELTRNYGVF
ncbi:MAG: nucleotidyltransferase domain-containing protein [Bryobacteraceae bacterium]|nr:nucleotidyltransferase domain-containing protein [Bryobacteraceae bacterium]